MPSARHLLSAALLGLFSAAAMAGPTAIYTSSASFMSHVSAGAYTENFNHPVSMPASFSGGGFAYALTTPSGIYASGSFVGANTPTESVTINFTGQTVKAIGANFFATDYNDAFQPATMNLLLSNGAAYSFTPTSMADSYLGFVSDVAITSLIVSSAGGYASLDNLTVGDAPSQVPEPASLALVGLGLAGALVSRRRLA